MLMVEVIKQDKGCCLLADSYAGILITAKVQAQFGNYSYQRFSIWFLCNHIEHIEQKVIPLDLQGQVLQAIA